ncbi:glycoside hydrolase family 38 C-terminal domain-containing protein [Acidipila sp. EB88]|uniref:alpha-mannosidase n=1 Tax=Acidipila sp. EB88 TaxID=2305226 RepID=UPI000F5F86EF|nr:glycoside hydrolase family 38 C-terminal domain-containing protein [Acidipila sp. EB88]RRA48089.1 alpha-mannosidase [Acidipila sp. EB88]
MNRTKRNRRFTNARAAACTALWAATLSGPGLQAQEHHEQLQQLVESLPVADRAVIDRLGDLNKFEAKEWHYHAGDLPHAESTSLDDAGWQVVQPGSEAPAGAVWYRRWIEVPKSLHGYSPAGTVISFRFEADAERDVTQIVYFNGRRVALGADLEPVVLFDHAKPGERILVAVKLLQTDGPKKFVNARLHVEYAENRPSPGDLRDEALSALALIPTLSKDPAADRKVVDKALSAIDVHALDASADAVTGAGQDRFDASLRTASQTLAALRPMLQQATFHEVGNSHIDAAWLWPATETVDVVRRTFGTAAQLLNEYPQYTYTQSAAQYNEWIAEKYPELNDQIKQEIKAGRWEIVGGMWVEPDLNLPDGESLVRSILIGKRFYMKQYGVDVHIGWNPDSFGYNWQLPQIYKKSGIDTFVTQKMEWNDTNQLPFKLFWWQSPDGSKVLTYFPHGYGNQSLEPLRLSTDFATARKQAPGLPSMLDLYGVGDHGGGPTRAMLDQGMHWAKPEAIAPKMEFGTADSYFKQVRPMIAADSKTWNYAALGQGAGYTYPAAPAAGAINIPTWNDELYLEYHRGIYTTQAKHKENMRNSEIETLDAEKFASLAWLGGSTYPTDTFTDAWKKITFNDFHDLAAGSGIGVIYRDAQKEFDTVRQETGEIAEASLKTLDAQVDTRGKQGVPVLVWNPLAWKRSEVVSLDVQMPEATSDVSVVDADGHVVPSQIIASDAKTNGFRLLARAEGVPSLGYTVLHVVPGKRDFASDMKADGLTIENDAVRVRVDKATGCITSLFDKKAQFETFAPGGCGNELQAFTDKPKDYDAWNIDPGTYDVAPTLIHNVDSVELVEHSPMRAVIRVKRKWQASSFTQEIALYAGADHALVTTDVDWRERHILLKAAFPLAATSDHATYEIPYGSIERPTTRNNSFEKARFEVPALRWADEGDGKHGFSLLNNSKYGYDGVGNLLRLTLLRSPTSPDAEADQGMQHFSYALYPHAGDWKQAATVEHGYNMNYPLMATQVAPHTGSMAATHSYASVDSADVIVTAIKKAEDSNALIVRMYESAGKAAQVHVTLPPGATGASITNLMENESGAAVPVSAGVASVSIHPYEILSLKVEYAH